MSELITLCDYVEISSQWILDTPTWEYDLNACINWMPYEGLIYSENKTSTYEINRTKPLYQTDFYETGICHFANASSYDVCQPNYKLDRFKCDKHVNKTNPLQHNSSYWPYNFSFKHPNPPGLLTYTLGDYERLVKNYNNYCCDYWISDERGLDAMQLHVLKWDIGELHVDRDEPA